MCFCLFVCLTSMNMCLPYDLEALDQASAHTKEETDGEAPAESEKQPTKAGKKNGQEIAVGQEV